MKLSNWYWTGLIYFHIVLRSAYFKRYNCTIERYITKCFSPIFLGHNLKVLICSEKKRIEYILEWNLIEKSVKRPFCCTVSILQLYFTYLGPGLSFYRKSKIIIKRKPNYEIGWFYNWPMIISHRLYAFHFTNDDFPL